MKSIIIVLLALVISIQASNRFASFETALSGAGAANKNMQLLGGTISLGTTLYQDHTFTFEFSTFAAPDYLVLGGGVGYYYSFHSPTGKSTLKLGGIGGYWLIGDFHEQVFSTKWGFVSEPQYNYYALFGGPSMKFETGSKLPRFYIGSKLLLGRQTLPLIESGILLNWSKRTKRNRPPRHIGKGTLLFRTTATGALSKATTTIGGASAIGLVIQNKHQLLATGTLTGGEGYLYGWGLEYGYRIHLNRSLTIIPSAAFTMSFSDNWEVKEVIDGYTYGHFDQYWPIFSIAIEYGKRVPRLYAATRLLIGDGIANMTELGVAFDFTRRRVK